MKKILLFLLLTLNIFANQRGLKIAEKKGNEGKRWAICIGINDYDDKAILDLEKAVNDAKSLAKVLENQGQFDKVYLMTSSTDYNSENFPSYWKIKDRIKFITSFLKEEDLLVLSFSGHGLSINNKSYLITKDTRIENVESTAISLEDDIISILKESGIKKTLFLIDACRENFQENKGINKDALKTKTFEKAELAAVFYATKSGYYSYEDKDSKYGAFSRFVIEGLKGGADLIGNKDNLVSFSELASFVEINLSNWALKNDKKQIPYTKIYGEKFGDLALSLIDGEIKVKNNFNYLLLIIILLSILILLTLIILFTKRKKQERSAITINTPIQEIPQVKQDPVIYKVPGQENMYYQTAGSKDDFLKQLKNNAQKGDVNSQYELAECYINAYYQKDGQKYYHAELSSDYEKAFYWYKKAAMQEHIISKFNLGQLYYDGYGVEENKEESVYWYKEASEGGYPPAFNKLGNAYFYGDGLDSNEKKAIENFKKAAELGNPEGQRALAYSYHKGLGIEKNPREAVFWYKKAILQGEIAAKTMLKDMAKEGSLEEKELARKLLKELGMAY